MPLISAMMLLALIACFSIIQALPTGSISKTIAQDANNEAARGIETVVGLHLPLHACKLPGTTCFDLPTQGFSTHSALVTHLFGRSLHHPCHFLRFMCTSIELDQRAVSERALDTDFNSTVNEKRIIKFQGVGAPWSSCGPPGFICAIDGTIVLDPAYVKASDNTDIEKRSATADDEASSFTDVRLDTHGTPNEKRIIKLSLGAPWSSCGPPGFICAYEVDEDLSPSAVPMAPATLATYGVPAATST